ncbi:hypothetical protein BDR03DRAFT_970291 [Suillus americanus]|nr:hypothetical protein BDR03DRAFT_970291 [Suillus americanus]
MLGQYQTSNSRVPITQVTMMFPIARRVSSSISSGSFSRRFAIRCLSHIIITAFGAAVAVFVTIVAILNASRL